MFVANAAIRPDKAFLDTTPEDWQRVMGTNPSYLQSSADARVKNYRDWGIPLNLPKQGKKASAKSGWALLQRSDRRFLAHAAAFCRGRRPINSRASAI